MAWIYRLENGRSLIPNDEMFCLDFLSVKKKWYSRFFEEVAIYGKNESGEGIFGFGKIMGEGYLKSSIVDPKKQLRFYDRTYFQMPIHLYTKSRFPLIPIRYLRHFPTYNCSHFQKPFNPYVLYFSSIVYDYKDFQKTYPFWSIWYSDEGKYWRLFVHFLRERSVDFIYKRRLLKNIRGCQRCGWRNHSPYFLEIHDTHEINFDAEFHPLNNDDLSVLCPSCHKTMHHKIIGRFG
ncbi:MAG: hypothetical protein RBR47_06240 [Bacteroidales bacterium]|jgi:hypothetical protein|nr:HNH endonuclease [Bacteroidales bacterium]NCU36990.1 hypothetical protein [Candidatus Falkowbacteria bacterium]MDD2631070.1 hypothetical protein [Bacteroidales bacterium]MDD3130619.1 hypothetical protein [Bacteroidales bacterium]MDD3527569.1 hypothetical protein [Bacteroidales bacterium]